jgi:hypothetical protein
MPRVSDTADGMAGAPRRLLRGAIAALAGIEAVLGLGFCAAMLGSSADPLGSSIATGVSILTAIPLALGVPPALFLTWRNRGLPFALALVLLTPIVWLSLMWIA